MCESVSEGVIEDAHAKYMYVFMYIYNTYVCGIVIIIDNNNLPYWWW